MQWAQLRPPGAQRPAVLFFYSLRRKRRRHFVDRILVHHYILCLLWCMCGAHITVRTSGLCLLHIIVLQRFIVTCLSSIAQCLSVYLCSLAHLEDATGPWTHNNGAHILCAESTSSLLKASRPPFCLLPARTQGRRCWPEPHQQARVKSEVK